MRTRLKSPLSRLCALPGRRALILLFLVGLFGLIGGLAPADAHAPASAVTRSHDGVTAPQPHVALGAAERYASPAAVISNRVSPSNPPDNSGVELCFSGCCCGMMCSAALPELTPSSSLMHRLHGRMVAARELAPESAPTYGMLRPPEA